jgi:hypothetical protein
MMSCYGKWFAEANDLLGDQGVAGLPPVGKLRDSDTASFFGEPLIIGMPDDAIRMIDDYQRRTRLTHLVMITVLPGSDPAKVAASMKLFAKEALRIFARSAVRSPSGASFRSRGPEKAKGAVRKRVLGIEREGRFYLSKNLNRSLGWLDFLSSDVKPTLAKLRKRPKLFLRHQQTPLEGEN